jgi:hypothetical protein
MSQNVGRDLPEHKENDLTDLGPLNIIRTETVLSRLPIHNLSKKGRVNIQITKKNKYGEIDLRWEVSYNDRRSYWIPGSYVTSNSMSAGSNALPRLRTLCTNSKNPKYSGSFS